ncbi:MAG: (4Fe-4S)-binding protein [bacterium]|nr:(4Fe-4S)-binding protein [bacterium]
MEKEATLNYSNDDITILWKPSLCIHSAKCWKGATGLLEVFNPQLKPWINPTGASTDKIIAQVNQCPSGALSYRHNKSVELQAPVISETVVETVAGGPLLVHGDLLVKDHRGQESKKSKVTAFCRCGNSANKPFCDGSHRAHKFEG